MAAVYSVFTSPNHAPVPGHLPTLIVTPHGQPTNVLYSYLHTNFNAENYLLTPSPQGDLCVAKLFPPSRSSQPGGKYAASDPGHGGGSSTRAVRCEASRNLKWTIANTGVVSPIYKLSLPSPDSPDLPLFQVSKPNPNAGFWSMFYFAYAGHLIPPKRIEFGKIQKNPPGPGGGGTRISITGKTPEEKAVWQTLGEGNEDCVEWVVLCAALNLLDDEILKAAEKSGMGSVAGGPPPSPGPGPVASAPPPGGAPGPRPSLGSVPQRQGSAPPTVGGGGPPPQQQRPPGPPQQQSASSQRPGPQQYPSNPSLQSGRSRNASLGPSPGPGGPPGPPQGQNRPPQQPMGGVPNGGVPGGRGGPPPQNPQQRGPPGPPGPQGYPPQQGPPQQQQRPYPGPPPMNGNVNFPPPQRGPAPPGGVPGGRQPGPPPQGYPQQGGAPPPQGYPQQPPRGGPGPGQYPPGGGPGAGGPRRV